MKMTGKKYFCCDASKGMWVDYYSNQAGRGMPVFVGTRGQRGHGLGSMLAGLFRRAVPMLKRGLSIFGKQALKTGLNVANDVVDGQNWKESARNRVPVGLRDGIKTFVGSVDDTDQTGSGTRRPRGAKRKRASVKSGIAKKRKTSGKRKKNKKKKKTKSVKGRKSKKSRRDIFG